MKRKVTCPHCGQLYHLGYTGTVSGCDECLEIVRDENGVVVSSAADRKKGAAK